MTLTDRLIATIRTAKRIDLADDKVPGLALRVTPSGAKTWAIRFRRPPGGRTAPMERLVLGTYPKPLSLAKARQAAQKALRRVDAGENPAAERRDARQAAGRTGDTVADLAKDYIAKHAKTHKRSWREDQRMLDADVLPAWRARKVTDLTRRDVRDLIESMAERAPIGANRCLALVRKMLNFAVQRDWIDANPAALIAKPGAEHSRERVLTEDEIRLVWAACETERPVMCALLRLRLVTAQRGGELAQLRWAEDVDLETGWVTIPGRVTKNKLPHRVPLSPPALDILHALPRIDGCDWVFPGRTDLRPLGDAKKGGQRIARAVLATLQQADPTITTFDFRGHDLRRTAATQMAEAGIAQADIAKVLNHAEGGPRATQVYNRYQYDREKRIALDTWARRLTAILEQTSADNVVPFAAEASR